MKTNNLIFTFGNCYKAEISGSSHDDMLKTVIRGLPSCFEINLDNLNAFLSRRAPGTNPVSSGRMEKDEPILISGGYVSESVIITDGTPLILGIKNTDVRKKDYSHLCDTPRPGHADYTGRIRYHDIDMSGGGPFSGRMTVGLCLAGGIAIQFLEQYGVSIGAHIVSIGTVTDELFNPAELDENSLRSLSSSFFPVLNADFEKKAKSVISEAKEKSDSVGGIVEAAAIGVPAGLGGAMNQGMESLISHSMYGIPAVKGVEFGNGFACSKLLGSENNDSFIIDESDPGHIRTVTNNHGGILGGITTGMPLICRVAIKPTPSIGRIQNTVNLRTMEPESITVSGRHDSCIVPRAVPVCESVLAISLLDAMFSQNNLPCDSLLETGSSLEVLRNQIDMIDNRLLELFLARMSVSSDIADYKRKNGLPVRNKEREEQVLKNIREKADISLSEYSEDFFSEIMRLSRKLQNEKLLKTHSGNNHTNNDACGLLGRKLSHSYSKTIHELIGLYKYELFPVEPDQLEVFIKNRDFRGLNVTIPYKKEVIPYCDRLTPLAMKINAVNTLFFDEEGKLCGGNTDYTGFLAASASSGITYYGKKVLILGTGATSLTVYHAVKDSGAAKIVFAGRHNPSEDFPSDAEFVTYDEISPVLSTERTEIIADLNDAEIIINTTPVGMYPENGCSLIDLNWFPACSGVFDVVYNPFLTSLLLQAKELGIPYTNGLKMLVAQAVASSEMFAGNSFEEPNPEILYDDKAEAVFLELEHNLENLVLIGMPGCGKTTVGKLLADKLDRTFIDTDDEIEKKEKMTIPELFNEKGEEYFRKAETKTVIEFGKNNSQIIATGGGTVLNKENMDALQQNGKIIWLKRPVEKLATSGRPLSANRNALEKIYSERLSLYRKYADISLSVDDDEQVTLSSLLTLCFLNA